VCPHARDRTDRRGAHRTSLPLACAAVLACLLLTGPASAGSLPPAPQPQDRPDSPVPLEPPFVVCPVDRPHRFTDDFGDARYFGGYHTHTGIDIMAPTGTPVRAPFDGFARTTSNAAGGLGVYVEGRNGFVYHAHLSRLGKLGRVRAGTIVGFVGNSGNALGSSPHNHFEWHPKGGPAVNPFRLLTKACSRRPASKQTHRVPAGRLHRLLIRQT
jgi:peptidoglycan LD-endopeptidase LytH